MAARDPAPRRETSAGGVVVRCDGAEPRVLLIYDIHRNWGFPKGHLHDGEAAESAARREVGEETGLRELALRGELGTIDWTFRIKRRRIHKFCHFFLYVTADPRAHPQRDEGIRQVRWCTVAEARGTLTHENARAILAAAGPGIAAACPGESG